MKKNKSLMHKRQKISKSEDESDRSVQFKWIVPFQLQLICKLMGIVPEKLLKEFGENLDHGAWNREGKIRAKALLLDYFLEMGYGQNLYSPDEIRKIFSELDAIGLLFPNTSDESLMDLFIEWRSRYYEYWFKKKQKAKLKYFN